MADASAPPNIQAVALQAAAAGGALWAMAKVFAVVFAPVPARKRDVVRALVESAFAIASALIGGRFVAPALVRWRGWRETETITVVGLIVGLCFWQAIPLVIRGALALLPTAIKTFFAAPPPPEAVHHD